jgi:hypothetical protein
MSILLEESSKSTFAYIFRCLCKHCGCCRLLVHMMLSLLAGLAGFAVPNSDSSELLESLACGSGNSVRSFSSSIPREFDSHSLRPSRMQLILVWD